MFKHVSIVGLGLMGGSVGLTLRRKKLAERVFGVARREESVRRALEMGSIDEGTTDIAKGAGNADIVIIAVPVGVICEMLGEMVPHLKSGCIVTDVGSTKSEVVDTVDKFLPENLYFVGSHPLAGSEKTGIESASDTLFTNATCILTPGERSSTSSVECIKTFWSALGMAVLVMTSEEHDFLLAFASHLPHLSAAGLVNLIGDFKDKDNRILHAVAGGFRDTTRIAAGSPVLWHDICMSNKEKIVSALRMYRELLVRVEESIERGDSASLMKFLEKAKDLRDRLD